jgi:sulfur carrier protein ThiS|tara:strand:+ start:63 stop:269 length:207 start_codon:yes stop_codon:yes gene_type:complete
MEWQVTIDNKTKMVDLPEGSTANDLVNRLDLHPDGVLVVTDEEKMKPIPLVIALPEKPIRIILVASGG